MAKPAAMEKIIYLLFCLNMALINPLAAQRGKPERVIVFMIDGLHWKVPAKLKMPVLNRLIKQGTYIEKSHMILPHHPTTGDYGRMHTSSFPNPVLQAGTIFIHADNKMLQDAFSPPDATAFITNTIAYASVSKGFTTAILDPQSTDTDVVETAIQLLSKSHYRYLRIHLQTPGNEGRYLSYTTPDKPYFRNIWGPGSPYVRYVEEADALLGKLVDNLEKSGKWASTLLIVSSDQGQSEIGWHPIIDEDSWLTPLLFTGPGIAGNRTLPYFEHTDLTPTIAHLMGVAQPCTDGGAGRFIPQILETEDANSFTHPRYIQTINKQMNEYNHLRAQIMIGARQDRYLSSMITFLENELLTPEPFYHQDRFTEWYRAKTTEHLIEANKRILEQMKNELNTSVNGRKQ